MGVSRQDEHGLVGRGVTEEFCVKVLKFEIMNSRKLFNHFSEVVLRTGFTLTHLKINRTTLDL
jgi:hypothetical protein